MTFVFFVISLLSILAWGMTTLMLDIREKRYKKELKAAYDFSVRTARENQEQSQYIRYLQRLLHANGRIEFINFREWQKKEKEAAEFEARNL